MSYDNSKNTIGNMAAIQTAIADQNSEELKALLADIQLDTLQKDYLLELAALGSDSEIETLIQKTPEKDLSNS
ncbi:hypothetical protein [Alteromonas lipolytica]|uniref:Uncharacterized protein n=1 Tax=Alteromonas lipolytica TaxID=1856405 RepID=A0A1E8FDV5_9ALTE|nr:hypothetical protein [Alteromonas lipolytica]OFI34112.1 hypothetical protein BFC17_21445 [Alteromonas lipolytica]GGF65288.1 hypothetical protein GCM10011338_17070 [Alteromonas lipolytica]